MPSRSTTMILLLLVTTTVFARDQEDLSSIVITAFAQSSDGFSSDEVLLEDLRRERFLEAVRVHATDVDEAVVN